MDGRADETLIKLEIFVSREGSNDPSNSRLCFGLLL